MLVSGANAQATINGAGATFPYPMYSKWFSEYHNQHPDIQFNYQSIGSGGGIRQVTAGTVDFGATDGPMTDDQLAAAKTKILHVPTVLGSVVPAYNVPGVTESLKFTLQILADVFQGKINNWNDAAMAKVDIGDKIPYGSVQNAKGKFVKADLDSTTAAAAAVAKTMPSDFRVSITNPAAPDAYPISSFTWLLIPVQAKEPAKGKIISDFLHWMLGP